MASQGSQQSSSGFVNESRIARRGHAAQFEMALPLNSQENTFTYSSPKIVRNRKILNFKHNLIDFRERIYKLLEKAPTAAKLII
jgi:hypothetical protein